MNDAGFRQIDVAARISEMVAKMEQLADLTQRRGEQVITLRCTDQSVLVYPGPGEAAGTPVDARVLGIEMQPRMLHYLLEMGRELPDDDVETLFPGLNSQVGIETAANDDHTEWRDRLAVTIDHEERTRPKEYDWRHLAVAAITMAALALVSPPWGLMPALSGLLVVAVQIVGFAYPLVGNKSAPLSAARKMLRPLVLFGATGFLVSIALTILLPDTQVMEHTTEIIMAAGFMLLAAPFGGFLDLVITTRLFFRE